MSLFPKLFCDFQRVDFESFPPLNLIPRLMKLPMVPAAKQHGEFIADLKTESGPPE
jgi:hypothetical protein